MVVVANKYARGTTQEHVHLRIILISGRSSSTSRFFRKTSFILVWMQFCNIGKHNWKMSQSTEYSKGSLLKE
ncbi:unnamed protein product [Lupinus luteus]|uniref:Uncharacterized protein n=1 Tax=Lupinus luteus TaxID=3873 RepID=A0AAV1Y3E9_LUPLU